MPSRLIDSLATTDALAAAFSDEAVLRAMLDVEIALARAQAAAGVIPAAAADVIARAAERVTFDVDRLVRDARDSATVTISFVQTFTARVAELDGSAARFVHWGATSQDIWDTALMLCVARSWSMLETDHQRLVGALSALSDRHATTVMLGRTLLQPAPPITFGLKAAGWLAALVRAWHAAAAAAQSARIVQFGGATGTLASLGVAAPDVERGLAANLGLSLPDAPWHSHRDRVATLVASCGVYGASLGKMAADIALLMQFEVGEVAERGGGSSSMPHKRNPSGCAGILAASTRLPGLVSAYLSGMIQTHERGVGGWHAEAPTVAGVIQATGSALSIAADLIATLTVDPVRMRANIDATHGVIFAERVTLLAAGRLGRDVATRLVAAAVERSIRDQRAFADVVAETPELVGVLSTQDLESLSSPEAYLGSAERFRRQLLGAAPTPVHE